MITPALVILLMILGWSSAAFAMLWGMLRVTRHHHRPSPAPHRASTEADPIRNGRRSVFLSA